MSRSKRYLIVGLIVGLVTILGLALLTSRGGPHEACLKFMTNVNDGKASAAYDLFTDAAKTKQSKSAWELQAAKLKGAFPKDSATLQANDALPNTSGKASSQRLVVYTTDSQRASCIVVQNKIDSFTSSPY